MGDNQRQVIRNEETVVAGQPEQTTVSQTQTHAGGAGGVTPVAPMGIGSTVQTTAASSGPSDQVVARNVAESYVDPAADKAATVDWINRVIWFIVGLLSILLLIRFVLLAAGADASAGFSKLIYSLTGWMVAPFAGLFGRPFNYQGSAGTGTLEFESLIAIVVLLLIGWGLTKLTQIALGTNRTTGTVISDTNRRTKL